MTILKPVAQLVMEPVFLDRETAAAALGGISTGKLDSLVRQGQINPQTLGGRVMFTPDELRRFAADCPSWEPS